MFEKDQNLTDIYNQGYKQAINDLLNDLIGYTLDNEEFSWTISSKDLQRFAIKYGVEIKEN